MLPFASMISAALPGLGKAAMAALPGFAGSLVTMTGSRGADRRARKFNRELRAQDREWFEADRLNERQYADRITNSDRAYAERMLADERRYARDTLVDSRNWDLRMRDEANRYNMARTADDRAYLDRLYKEDVDRYSADRNLMQTRSDRLAEQTAASRGIDFVKLRDDAVKAGYNPMTALSMAHAYSTQVDYSLQGGVYSPRANYQTGSMASAGTGGGGGGGGAGMAAPGAVMPSNVAAGMGFQTNGSGYQGPNNAGALASGQFVAEALQRGVDQWTNRDEGDPLADALRSALKGQDMAREVRDAQIPQGFGYDLTKAQPFRPAGGVAAPPLRPKPEETGIGAPTVKAQFQIDGKDHIPVRSPNDRQIAIEKSVADRLDIKPFDKLMAEDYEALFGEMAGEPISIYDSPLPYGTNSTLQSPKVDANIGDYLESGITGNKMMVNPWRELMRRRNLN